MGPSQQVVDGNSQLNPLDILEVMMVGIHLKKKQIDKFTVRKKNFKALIGALKIVMEISGEIWWQ